MKKVAIISLLTMQICVFFFQETKALEMPQNEKQMIMNNLSSMPLTFTENRGQWDENALFRAEAGGAIFWFCKDQVVYQFMRDTDQLIESSISEDPNMQAMPDKFSYPRYKKESMVLEAHFIGANLNAEVIGENRLSYNCNYFYGNDPNKWRANVPNYSTITYRDIWPGIDLCYHGNGQGMKYDFIVNPGADVSQIRVCYEGVNDLTITTNGDLQADTRFGLIYENIPFVYQEIGGGRRNTIGRYIIVKPGVFGFALTSGYDPAFPLVIDPELVYSTYLGGNSYDSGFGIVVDGSGCAYVTGSTNSTNFPTQNPYQSDQLSSDVFVTKLSASGNSLVYSTYLGGNGSEGGQGIAVDGSGNAYMTGYTYSNNFPTQNPYQTDQDTIDIFVTKLSPSGNSLVYSTYLGGNDVDYGCGIAVDGSGSAYVTGYARSTNFPTQNPYQTDQPYDDAFVTKLSASGNSLVYSTYLGGSDYDNGWGIAVDGAGNAYVTGYSASTNFPTQNPYQADQASADAFVTKLSPEGNFLVYSTYLGGIEIDYGYGIAVDGSGSAYVTGSTNSANFPTQNPYQIYQRFFDVFVTKLSASGNSLVYSTYLGGNAEDYGYGIAVDGSGNAYVTGVAYSSDFPIRNPYQTDQLDWDVFVTELSPSGNSLIYSTYLGGNDEDYGYGIAVDGSGNAYVTGKTSSENFPTQTPYQTDQPLLDAFVTKFGFQTGIGDDDRLPSVFGLSRNYPNPFNVQTMIQYSLPVQSLVAIDIFDIHGRKMETLVEGIKPAGEYQTIWDASDQASGIYFYRIKAGDNVETKKMMLMK